MEFILKLVNSFHNTFKLNGLADFFRKLTLTGIAFSTMLFLAVLSIQGIGGHILDSLSLRTVKYVAGTAIPVVGGTLSGLVETLMSGAAMIKSAVGLIGLLAVILLTVLPAMKILMIYFMYSFTAAVLQPVGDDGITNLLEQTAGSFVLLFAIVALTGVFFFFMILIVLAAGGAVLGG
jgi:stage III sporulation protein AE